MKKETRNLILPEGNISSPVMFFEESDRTFSDQQNQGRRPRFSIPKELITPYGLKPSKIGNIEDW